MTPPEYNKALVTAWRKRFLPIMLDQEKQVLEIFQASYDDLSKLLLDNAGKEGTLMYKRWEALRAQTQGIIGNMTKDYASVVRNNMFRSAEEMASTMTEITSKYIATWDATIQGELAINFSLVPTDAVMASITKPYYGYTFSERVWNIGKATQAGMEKIVSTGIARGQSAWSMAKELQEKYMGGGKHVSYEALRLARTEINNAYWDAHEMAAEQSPVVKGLKWNLSATHRARMPKGDICDEYATQNKQGLGRGVFKPGTVPRKHPNCLCYLTDELYSERELKRIMRSAA